MSQRALLFGCGYLGKRVAALWRAAGWQVNVVTRFDQQADEFRRQGYAPIVADVANEATLSGLPEVDVALFAVGYDRNSSRSIEEVYLGGVRNVLAHLPASTGRFIYISTTGVYGDAGGQWVDEQTAPLPARAGGKASLAAESAIRASPLATRSTILRLAGIYGPGRLPYLSQLKAGEPIEASPTGHLNLIHVDDAARIVQLAALAEPRNDGPQLYCVSDGHPVVRGEYYRQVARLLGAPEPRFWAPAPDSPRGARAASDKRVSNRRLLAALDVDLLYPSYRKGLAAIIAAADVAE